MKAVARKGKERGTVKMTWGGEKAWGTLIKSVLINDREWILQKERNIGKDERVWAQSRKSKNGKRGGVDYKTRNRESKMSRSWRNSAKNKEN